jgi:hypothetical protein
VADAPPVETGVLVEPVEALQPAIHAAPARAKTIDSWGIPSESEFRTSMIPPFVASSDPGRRNGPGFGPTSPDAPPGAVAGDGKTMVATPFPLFCNEV